MQRTDIGHGRGWLDVAAAASLARVDRALGHPIQITEAGRTGERQQQLRDLYESGKGSYAAKRGESPHEVGNAIDTNERPVALLAEHGWKRTLDFEPWHFVYSTTRDRHRNQTTGSGTTQPTPTPQEDNEMSMQLFRHPDGTIYFIDELGADHLGDYKTADISQTELINVPARAFGRIDQLTDREFDVAKAIATRRWERKKAEIVAAVVEALKA